MGQAWWYTPVIPATLEFEAGWLQIRGQPGQLSEILFENKKELSGRALA
jgi:hypothetical protein